MARNEHKKVLHQLSKAYHQVHETVEHIESPAMKKKKEKDKAYQKYMWDVGEYNKPGGTKYYDKKPEAADYGLSEDAEDVDHLVAEVKKRTQNWMAREGPTGQRMTAEQAFKAAIEMIQFDLGSYTIDNIEL